MCVTFTKLLAGHMKYINPEGLDAIEFRELFTPETSEIMSRGNSVSAWVSGKCIGAAGIVCVWTGRGEAWLVLDKAARPHIRALVCEMRAALDASDLKRIEMVVRVGHKQGHKLARLLGFVVENPLMRKYHPNGQDAVMYVRIK